MILKKMFILFLFIFSFNTIFLYSSLEDDKNELLSKVNYKEENTLVPIINGMYNQALISYFKNDFETAIFYYKKILDIDDNFKDSKFLLEIMEKMTNYPVYEAKGVVISEYLEKAKEHYENQHYLAALNIWEKILVLKPKKMKSIKNNINDTRKFLADPYYERGWDFYNKEEYDRAIEEWENVIALVPKYAGIEDLIDKTKKIGISKKINDLILKIEEFLNSNDVLNAKILIDKALIIAPNNDNVVNLNNKIIGIMNKNFRTNFNIALKNYNDKNYKNAINYFNIALQFALNNKDKSQCNNYIISANREMRKVPKKEKKEEQVVVEKEEPVVEKIPEEVKIDRVVDTEAVRKHYTQGLYYYRNGYTNKAITEWEIALSLDPENERVYTSLQKAKVLLNKKTDKSKE